MSQVTNSVRLRSSRDRRFKEDFMCFQEQDLPFMQHPALKKEKLQKYENDNDYASDKEQVQENQKTIMKELQESLRAFSKGDAVTGVINLENEFVPGVIPKGID